jgi:hypothetical protein
MISKFQPGRIRIKPIPTLLFFSLLTVLNACSWFERKPGEDVVARVNNQYLYRSDLGQVIPANIPAADSTAMARRYIESWIRQQVLVQEALRELSSENLDFDKKIEDYRNSLIIFAWETEQVLNKLDTLITEAELAGFYEEHQAGFLLNENIVRIHYVKVPLDAPNQQQVRRLIRSDDPSDLEALEEYSLQHAAAYLLDSDSWMFFNDMLREMPIQTNNPEAYLRNNTMVEISDNYYRYFLRILDYKLKGNTAPLAFERENIRNVLMNKRKMQFLNQARNQVYQEALDAQRIETFY